ncbi:uncharacterized protein LOC127719461 isoform X3 [Mytilus californianus]|nr:uncharacterized protein LOC127719461 isoform X3 [Mytilus californianus]
MSHIYYKQLNRYCFPYYDCEPENEIQPCTVNSTRDLCRPCVDGMVQPDLISSSVKGSTSDTACFRPENDCLAQDITNKRNWNNADRGLCDSLHGCKCKTIACFYGDPCLCDEKRDGCQPGTTLNEAGECIPCPNGTYKNDNGCGPCRHLQRSNHIVNPTTQNARIVSTYISLPSPAHVQMNPNRPEENNNLLVIFIVALSVLIILLSMVTIAICFKRSGFVLAGICWTHGRGQPDSTDHIHIEPLIKVANQDDNVTIRKTEGRNITDNPGGQPQWHYPSHNFKSGTQADVMSISNESGFHEGNGIIAAVNGKCENCKKSTDSTSNYYNTYRQALKQQLTDVNELPTNAKTSGKKDMKIEKKLKNKMQKPLSIDIPTMNPNDSFNVSDTCSPVTTDSEPHTLWTGIGQAHQSDTSGYQTQYNEETLPSTFAASGDYMSMNVSTLSSRSDTNETILSNLENYVFEIKGINMNTFNSMNDQSETEMKHCGQNSIDSGVSLTYKHPGI